MTNHWRLINGIELFDMRNDPGQQVDVADQFPQELKLLRTAYDGWWLNTSSHFAEEPPIHIGTPFENPVALTAHDWHTVDQEVPWNQFNIRRGKKGKVHDAYWIINVVETGAYNFQLSRYPKESGLAINTSVPSVSAKELPGLEADIPAGQSLSFEMASVILNGETLASKKVDNKKSSVDFTLSLPKGLHNLSAVFTQEDGMSSGAYYIMLVRKNKLSFGNLLKD